MDQEKISLDSDIGRALVCGLILGVILTVLGFFLRSVVYSLYVVDLVLLIIVGLVSYRFVGSSVPGLILGVLTLLVQEFLWAFLFGGIPFGWMQYMQESWFVSEVLPYVAISLAGFPLVGFLGGYIFEKRNMNIASPGDVPLTNLENRVFEYIRLHDNKIQISHCALELGVDSSSIRKALKSLERKRRLKS